MTIQLIPLQPSSPPIKSISLQFREKDAVGDRDKGLTGVQINLTSIALPLSTDAVTPSQQATRLVRQDLHLVKPCWLSQNTSPSSMCLSLFFGLLKIYSHQCFSQTVSHHVW